MSNFRASKTLRKMLENMNYVKISMLTVYHNVFQIIFLMMNRTFKVAFSKRGHSQRLMDKSNDSIDNSTMVIVMIKTFSVASWVIISRLWVILPIPS